MARKIPIWPYLHFLIQQLGKTLTLCRLRPDQLLTVLVVGRLELLETESKSS